MTWPDTALQPTPVTPVSFWLLAHLTHMGLIKRLFRQKPKASSQLVICPMPSLVATLLNRERAKGTPLTEAEVIEIRDGCPSVVVPIDIVEKMDTERGYKDIDPERCWEQWQEARKSLI